MEFFGTFWSLVPPFIAIALALITKEVYSSLFIGIVAGGLLATGFSFTGTVDAVIGDGLISAVEGNAGIFIFLVVLGVLVALMHKAGAAHAFGRFASKHIKTKVGALVCTILFGILIFNKPFDKENGKYPKIYLSRDSREEWGGNLLMLVCCLNIKARSDKVEFCTLAHGMALSKNLIGSALVAL